MRRLAVTVLALALAAGTARAAEAEGSGQIPKGVQVYRDLFAEAVTEAKASPGVEDNHDLAGRLLKAAQSSAEMPEFVALAANAAFDLTIEVPDQLPLAGEAVDLLEATYPELEDSCAEMRARVYQGLFAQAKGGDKARLGQDAIDALLAAGDARVRAADLKGAQTAYRQALGIASTIKSNKKPVVQARMTDLRQREHAMQQVKMLKRRLTTNPSDQAARDELVRLFLIEFDNPKEAARHLPDGADDLTAKLTLVAGMSTERLPARALLQLGDWYRKLVQGATVYGRATGWGRAAEYYAAFLERGEGDEAEKTRARMAKGEAEAELAEARKELAGSGKTARADPKLAVVMPSVFETKYGRRFPPEKSLAKGGAGGPQGGTPELFTGRRFGSTWSASGSSAKLEITWQKPLTARYVVLFGSFAGSGRYGYGTGYGAGSAGTYVSVNDCQPIRLRTMGLPGPRVAVLDLGVVCDVKSLELTFTGWYGPYVSGIEVHY